MLLPFAHRRSRYFVDQVSLTPSSGTDAAPQSSQSIPISLYEHADSDAIVLRRRV